MSSPLNKAVVFFANGLGDYILTLPSLRALAWRLPTPLTLVTDDCPADLLFGDVGFSEIVMVPMSRLDWSTARSFDAASLSKRIGDADYFISLVPWDSIALRRLIEGSNFEATFGFGPGFDFSLRLDPDRHAADRSFDLVKKFGEDFDIMDFAEPISLPSHFVTAASRIRQAVGGDRRILVVHEETSTPAKRWDSNRMRRMLETITAERPDLTAILVSRYGASFDIRGLEDQVVSIDRVSFGFFLALIAEADAFVGVDSVGFHAADLSQTPAVGLFGPTRPEEWGGRFSPCAHVYGAGSMERISVEAVLAAVRSIMPPRLEVRSLERR